MPGLLRHLRRCNEFDAAGFLPLLRGTDRIGLVRRDNAAALRRFPALFAIDADAVRLVADGGPERLTGLVDDALERLAEEGLVGKWRNERFDVAPRWGAPPIFRVDRGAVPFLGVRAYGVHMNGWQRSGAETRLWVGKRAADKAVEPGKLDNLVAGGIGADHGVRETLLKEAREEADLGPDVMARARPVGAVTYRMADPAGVRDDVLFCWDLEVPAGVTPRNTDGEIASFALMPAHEALDILRAGNAFKFNVALVVIDFAIRHGLLDADDPEYLDLVAGLRRGG